MLVSFVRYECLQDVSETYNGQLSDNDIKSEIQHNEFLLFYLRRIVIYFVRDQEARSTE